MGFLLRLIGCLILAAGTVFAIGDIARSLSAEALRLTSVAEAMTALGRAPTFGEGALPFAGDLWAMMAQWPVSPTLAVIAFALLLIGRPRPQPARYR